MKKHYRLFYYVIIIIFLLILTPLADSLHINQNTTSVKKHGSICGYIYASDGITTLENATVTFDAVDCIWFTDKYGYFEINDIYWDGKLDMYAMPPYEYYDVYMPSFKLANIVHGQDCWVNFTLDDYRNNKPPYNFTINGPVKCKIGVKYEYTLSAKDPENDQIYFIVYFDYNFYDIYTANDSGEIKVNKTWEKPGDYRISGNAIDKYSYFSDPASLEVKVTDSSNNPPDKPKLKLTKYGMFVCIEIKITDPDDNQIHVIVDWGDGATSKWLGPYSSGETIHIYYRYQEKGEYTIRVKAKDEYEAESDWSSIVVDIPKNKVINTKIIHYFKNEICNILKLIL